HLYHPAHSSPTPRPRRSLSPTPPLSPYTTLFRSIGCLEGKREPLLAVHARLGTPPEGRSRNLITQVCDYRGFSPVELHGESIHRLPLGLDEHPLPRLRDQGRGETRAVSAVMAVRADHSLPQPAGDQVSNAVGKVRPDQPGPALRGHRDVLAALRWPRPARCPGPRSP